MITLFGIKNMNQFFNVVDQCNGPVIAAFSENEEYDLETNKSIRKNMQLLCNGYQGSLCLKLTCSEDIIRMIDYMSKSYC